jgi:magnesium-transporting ATPase (P-type)
VITKLPQRAVAMVLGIINSEEDLVLTGSLSWLTDQEFEDIVEKFVFMRVNPEQKLK